MAQYIFTVFCKQTVSIVHCQKPSNFNPTYSIAMTVCSLFNDTFSVTQTIYHQMKGSYADDELERIWEDAVMVSRP
jgi:hypothetical protein